MTSNNPFTAYNFNTGVKVCQLFFVKTPPAFTAKSPVTSAKNHPMGTDAQIPLTPIQGTAERVYARATRVPKEMTVSTTDIPGLLIARKYP